MRLLFLLFPMCRRATDIGMETPTDVILAKDLAQEIGIPDEPHDPEQMYEGLQFRRLRPPFFFCRIAFGSNSMCNLSPR
jgi:hypothetical protein